MLFQKVFEFWILIENINLLKKFLRLKTYFLLFFRWFQTEQRTVPKKKRFLTLDFFMQICEIGISSLYLLTKIQSNINKNQTLIGEEVKSLQIMPFRKKGTDSTHVTLTSFVNFSHNSGTSHEMNNIIGQAC